MQADDQRLPLHPVRHRQPVLHDRRASTASTSTASSTAAGTTIPRMAGHARPRVRGRARAWSRTRCSWPPSARTRFRSATPRCWSTRACRPASSSSRAGTSTSPRRPSAILGMAFKAESDDPRDSLSYKLRKLLALEARRVLCTDPYVPDPTLGAARARWSREADVLFVATPHRAYRELARSPRARSSYDVWNWPPASGPALKVLVTGSAGFIAGYLVQELLDAGPRGRRRRQLLQVRPGREELPAPSRLPFVAGRRQGRRAPDASSRADCDHFVAGAARSAASPTSTSTPTTCSPRTSGSSPPASTPPSPRSSERRLLKITVLSSSMVFENATVFPTPEEHVRRMPAADEHLRLPEARLRVLRAGRAGSSTGCRTRSAARSTASASARAARSADKDIPSGNVRLAMSHVVPDLVQKIAQGPGPAAHPRHRGAGALLHLRRRPRPGHRRRDVPPGRAQRGLQPLDADADDGASSSPRRSGARSTGPAPREAVPLRRATRLSRTTSPGASPTRARRAEVLGFEATTGLSEMLDEVVPWIRDGDRRGAHLTAGGTPGIAPRYSLVVPVYNEGGNIAAFCRAPGARAGGLRAPDLPTISKATTRCRLSIALSAADRPPCVRLVLNTLGKRRPVCHRGGAGRAYRGFVLTVVSPKTSPESPWPGSRPSGSHMWGGWRRVFLIFAAVGLFCLPAEGVFALASALALMIQYLFLAHTPGWTVYSSRFNPSSLS